MRDFEPNHYIIVHKLMLIDSESSCFGSKISIMIGVMQTGSIVLTLTWQVDGMGFITSACF